jgi:hypothetical protein
MMTDADKEELREEINSVYIAGEKRAKKARDEETIEFRHVWGAIAKIRIVIAELCEKGVDLPKYKEPIPRFGKDEKA